MKCPHPYDLWNASSCMQFIRNYRPCSNDSAFFHVSIIVSKYNANYINAFYQRTAASRKTSVDI